MFVVEKVDKNKKQRGQGGGQSIYRRVEGIQKTARVEQDPEPIAKGLS